MAGTDPLTGARLGDMNDGPLGGLYLAEVVDDLSSFTKPRFPTVADRDAAYSAWVAAGHTMVDGMSCWCDNPGVFFDRIGGAWVQRNMGPQGLLYNAQEAAKVLTTSADDERIAGGQNIASASLQPGRAYASSWAGIVGTNGSGGLVVLRTRINKTLVPTTASPTVSVAQRRTQFSGGPGEIDFGTRSIPFAVSSSGTYQIHTFGDVTNDATSVYVNPLPRVASDGSGFHVHTLTDLGPAPAGILTI